MGNRLKQTKIFMVWVVIALLIALIRVTLAFARVHETAGGVVDVERIDRFVSEEVDRNGIPGLALALVDRDHVIFIKGYGKANDAGQPVTPQTPFILASVSKPLTAAAIMQLVEAGKVELDKPVQHYLPEFRVDDPVASSQITVRHLLLHTSGLPTTACDTRKNATTLAEYVAELETVKLAAPVGTRHSYCSGNYNIIGRIIEIISGQPFGDYMQMNIFSPLDMKHSFTSELEAQRAGLAQGYQWFFGLPLSIHHTYNPSQIPSGYMISSVEDMSHFLIAQLNQGQYLQTSLLSAETISGMQVSGTERGNGGGYGFGWVISPIGDVPSVWHDGVNVNFHSLLLMQPATQRGVVLLTNSFGIVAYESAYKEIETGIVRLLAGMELPAPAPSIGNLYIQINLLLIALLAIVVWPLLQILKWHRWLAEPQKAKKLPLERASLRAAWEITFALLLLTGIKAFVVTGLGAQSWYEFLTVFPDFVVWIWLFVLIILITGVIRLKLVVQTRRQPIKVKTNQPVGVTESYKDRNE